MSLLERLFGKKEDPTLVLAVSSPAPQIGDEMEDGTILTGYYGGKPLYTTPADAPLTYTFNEAAKYAEQLNAQKYLGHDDWRVPTKSELNVLFNNHAAIGGFNEAGSNRAGWYWSSSPDYFKHGGWAQRFSDGDQYYFFRNVDSSLRCVR